MMNEQPFATTLKISEKGSLSLIFTLSHDDSEVQIEEYFAGVLKSPMYQYCSVEDIEKLKKLKSSEKLLICEMHDLFGVLSAQMNLRDIAVSSGMMIVGCLLRSILGTNSKKHLEDFKSYLKRNQYPHIVSMPEFTAYRANDLLLRQLDNPLIAVDDRRTIWHYSTEKKSLLLEEAKSTWKNDAKLLLNSVGESFRCSVQEMSKSQKESKFTRDFKDYIVLFKSVFTVKEMTSGFMKHLDQECNSEGFEFLLKVDMLCDDTSQQNIRIFYEIFDEYLAENAPKPINVPGTLVAKVRRLVTDRNSWSHEQSPKEVLHAFRVSVFTDLKIDSFPRFLCSDDGWKTIQSLKSNPNVVTKDPLKIVQSKVESRKMDCHDSYKYGVDTEDLVKISEDLCMKGRVFTNHFEPLIESDVSIPVILLYVGIPTGMDNKFVSAVFHDSIQPQNIYLNSYRGVIIGNVYIYWDRNYLVNPQKINGVEFVTLTSALVQDLRKLPNLKHT